MHKRGVPQNRFKYVTYRKFVCDVRPTKVDKNRMRLTIGGDIINYPGDCGTPKANILLVKMLVNSLISIIGAKFMTGDIKNFYFSADLK